MKGARVEGKNAIPIDLIENRALPIRFPLQVGSPPIARDPKEQPKLVATLGVERKKDEARDAFRVELPIRPDRDLERSRLLKTLMPGETLAIEGVTDPIRAGTAERSVLISDEPALVRMAAGLDFLLEYPHGSTEARVSRARAYVAMKRFREALALEMDERSIDRAVEETLEWIGQVVDGNGLCAYWPGSKGYVSLTAWTLELLIEAKAAGYRVDASLMERLIASLERALRSDYPYFISGAQWAERTYALEALARAQRFSPAYAAELARKANYLDLASTAGVVQAFAVAGKKSDAVIGSLSARLWNGVIFRLHQGREIYGGLQDWHGALPSLILPSETRTLAEMVRAHDMIDPSQAKLQLLTDALITLGRDDGWGSTNANAAAMLALVERIEPGKASETHRIEIAIDGKKESLEIGKSTPTRLWKTDRTGPMKIAVSGGNRPVIVRVETRYLAAAPGSAVEVESRGFVVTRENLRVRENAPAEKIRIEEANKTIELAIGDVIEEHVQVVNPKDRSYVAITVPLAAGMEPMNPNLATSPAEARPAGTNTRAPTYLAFLDDRVTYYFDSLPKGTYDFYFRTRASTEGTFTQPAAHAEMMYDSTVFGCSPGARIQIRQKE